MLHLLDPVINSLIDFFTPANAFGGMSVHEKLRPLPDPCPTAIGAPPNVTTEEVVAKAVTVLGLNPEQQLWLRAACVVADDLSVDAPARKDGTNTANGHTNPIAAMVLASLKELMTSVDPVNPGALLPLFIDSPVVSKAECGGTLYTFDSELAVWAVLGQLMAAKNHDSREDYGKKLPTGTDVAVAILQKYRELSNTSGPLSENQHYMLDILISQVDTLSKPDARSFDDVKGPGEAVDKEAKRISKQLYVDGLINNSGALLIKLSDIRLNLASDLGALRIERYKPLYFGQPGEYAELLAKKRTFWTRRLEEEGYGELLGAAAHVFGDDFPPLRSLRVAFAEIFSDEEMAKFIKPVGEQSQSLTAIQAVRNVHLDLRFHSCANQLAERLARLERGMQEDPNTFRTVVRRANDEARNLRLSRFSIQPVSSADPVGSLCDAVRQLCMRNTEDAETLVVSLTAAIDRDLDRFVDNPPDAEEISIDARREAAMLEYMRKAGLVEPLAVGATEDERAEYIRRYREAVGLPQFMLEVEAQAKEFFPDGVYVYSIFSGIEEMGLSDRSNDGNNFLYPPDLSTWQELPSDMLVIWSPSPLKEADFSSWVALNRAVVGEGPAAPDDPDASGLGAVLMMALTITNPYACEKNARGVATPPPLVTLHQVMRQVAGLDGRIERYRQYEGGKIDADNTSPPDGELEWYAGRSSAKSRGEQPDIVWTFARLGSTGLPAILEMSTIDAFWETLLGTESG